MLSTSPDGSADKIQVFDFKMNYKLLSPSTISLYTPTFLSTMLQIVIVLPVQTISYLGRFESDKNPSRKNDSYISKKCEV